MNNGYFPTVGYRQHIHRQQPHSVLASMYTIPEAAKALGVPEHAIIYRIRTKELPTYRRGKKAKGNPRLIKKADLQRVFGGPE